MHNKTLLNIFVVISFGVIFVLLILSSKLSLPRFCNGSINCTCEDSKWKRVVTDTGVILVDKNSSQQIRVCDIRSVPEVDRLAWSPYHIPLTAPNETSLTVVILTYNRVDFLRRSIKHYERMSVVDKVVVLWSDVGNKVPEDLISQNKKPVIVELQPANLLRLRFRPLKPVKTEAVLSLDDDVILAENDLQHALDVWKNHSYGLVGFLPRGHKGYNKDNLAYRGKGGLPYSLILTGAAIFHVNYLQMFNETLPLGIQETVDKLMNCEDIAMNFMVNHHCKCAGVFYVRAKQRVQLQRKPGNMLHSRPGHYANRSICLRQFLSYYPNLPLQEVQCVY